MHLHKQWYKNQNTKTYLNYSYNNTICSFKQAKFCNVCPIENFKNSNKIIFLSASMLACPSACQQDLETPL